MNYKLLLQSVLKRVARYKAKAVLMGIGIVIGVMTIAVVQTLGSGALEAVTNYTNHYFPADTIVLISRERGKLRQADVEAAAAASPRIAGWDPILNGDWRNVKVRDQSFEVQVTGYSSAAEAIGHRSVSQGDFLSPDDTRVRAHVALIGSTTAKKLFGTDSPVGAELYVDNVPFKIKGVLESLGIDPHGEDQDDTLVLPYTTLMEQMLRVDYLSAARFVITGDDTDTVGKQIQAVMRERHAIDANREDDFTLITPGEMRQRVSRSLMIYRIFLPLISGTAFFISGLVILSIMLASIKERTGEIGLRKAIGAKPAQIQTQLVLEVVVVSAVACLIGIIAAKLVLMQLAPALKAHFGIVHASPSLFVLALAAVLALLTGIAGALLPARQAARLEAAVALK